MSRPLPQPPVFTPPAWEGSEQRLTELAGRISRTLGVARALADNGRQLDLAGIEDGVGALCAQTLDMQPGEAHCMLPVLREVLCQVDQLTAALTRNANERQPGGSGPAC